MATGPFQQPAIPGVASGFAAEVTQLHSSTYRNPTDLPSADAGKVLVVGAGNSGLQIALEVAAHPPGPPRGRHPAEDSCRSGPWAATCSGG